MIKKYISEYLVIQDGVEFVVHIEETKLFGLILLSRIEKITYDLSVIAMFKPAKQSNPIGFKANNNNNKPNNKKKKNENKSKTDKS